MFKKLFNNKLFIFIFAFIVEFIFYFIFEHLPTGGEYMLVDLGIGPIFGLMFGPIGAFGVSLSSLIWEIYEGMNIYSSLIDFGIMLFCSLLMYKLWYSIFNKNEINTPKFNSMYNILKFLVISIIVSVVYWIMINISFLVNPDMNIIYPLINQVDRISYVLNLLDYTIIFGLLLISIFNILKIPLQSPKKMFISFNIDHKYFLLGFIIIFIYLILTITGIITNDMLDNIFFALTIILATLFCLNNPDVNINIKSSEYSVIEKVILIFLIILSITMFLILDDFNFVLEIIPKSINPEFIPLITLTYISMLILVFTMIHIYYVEKKITDPIYDLIDATTEYTKIGALNSENEFKEKFKKYLKSNDDISRLIESFINLNRNIKRNLKDIEKTTADKERIETELNIASNIQSNMLKTDFDDFCENKPFEIYAFMSPAREVGGDFYDYFQIDDEHIGFVIGDVSGKGVPATLFMVKTMHLIKTHSEFSSNPEDIFEKVNDLSCKRNDEELFVTSWFGKLNIKTGKISFVNAGHNPPLIKQNNGNFEYLNIKANFVLGGIENIPYQEHELNFKSGDTILLYTDGITEANNDYKDFYGEERLKSCINKYKNENLKNIAENIKNDIFEFCQTDDQFDDMTMIIIRFTGGENNE